jgi:hypothetical protein
VHGVVRLLLAAGGSGVLARDALVDGAEGRWRVAAAIPSITLRLGSAYQGRAVGVLPHRGHRGGGHDEKQRFAFAFCRSAKREEAETVAVF